MPNKPERKLAVEKLSHLLSIEYGFFHEYWRVGSVHGKAGRGLTDRERKVYMKIIKDLENDLRRLANFRNYIRKHS